MYSYKTPKHNIKSRNKEDKGLSFEQNMPNSLMNSIVNSNQEMENEADRVSAEVGASCNRLDEIKSALGSRLGVDFSNVKVHTDDAADRAAKSYNARAFTKGGDVYLGKDGMNPTIAAHELVHTVQQGAVSGGGVMSAPEGQVQLWGKKKPAPKGLLDLDSMNFGKTSYKMDKDYKNLKKLMKNFNKSNGSDEDRAALMEAAMQYIDKNSRGKEAKHVGRTANAEKLLYQLSMDQGQQEKGMANIYRMKNQMAAQGDEYGRTNQAEGHEVLKDLGKAVQGKGNFSNAMSMITANVMADQDKTDYALGKSDSARVFGEDMDPDNYRYMVHGLADSKEGAHNDNVGTNLHEFTHASVGESYDNTRMLFSADRDSSKEDLFKIRDDRYSRLKTIKDCFAPHAGVTKQTFDTRFQYATMSKLYDTYAPGFLGERKTRDVNGNKVKTRQGGSIDRQMDQASPSVRMKLAKERAQANKMVTPFADVMEQKQDDYRKAKAYADRMYEQKKANPGNAEYEKLSKEADAKMNAITADFSVHDNTLVEYDSVINQLLMEHELGSSDRDSQYYRELKAAALRAHVDRAKAKMKKNKKS